MTQQTSNSTNNKHDHLLQIFIGGCAGISAKTGVAPLERLKTIYQVNTQQQHNMSIWSGLRHMYQTEGVRGLFRGNLANCIKTAPTSAFKFFCYEKLKRFFAPTDAQLTHTQVFWSGSLSGIAAHIVFYPLDVIKTRLSATHSVVYRGMFHVVVNVISQERSIVPFFRGMSASILSTLPQSGIQLTVYEALKHVLVPPQQSSSLSSEVEQRGAFTSSSSVSSSSSSFNNMRAMLGLSIAGGTSALVSQAVIYPLKTVKSRMIMQGQSSLNGTLPTYNGLWDVCRQTMRSGEGIMGFYKGFWPNMVKAVPSHCIAFTVYDTLKRLFHLEKRLDS